MYWKFQRRLVLRSNLAASRDVIVLGLVLRTINVGLGTQGLNFKAKARPNPTQLVYHQH